MFRSPLFLKKKHELDFLEFQVPSRDTFQQSQIFPNILIASLNMFQLLLQMLNLKGPQTDI